MRIVGDGAGVAFRCVVMKTQRFAAIVALTAALAAFGVAASAQTTSESKSKPAANAWMLTPTPYLEWNKDVPPSVRAGRDRYSDQGAVGQKYPLTSPRSDAPGPGIGGGIPRSDIRPAPDRVVLAGTFTNHRSVLSASEFSLYTEVTVHVDEVFDDQGASRAHPDKDITILVGGGTVTLASGRILSYDTEPIRFSLQPAHKYLLLLSYRREGDFYALVDDWDISDGTVRPNTVPSEYRASHGLSSLSGLSVQQLAPALDKLLHENP